MRIRLIAAAMLAFTVFSCSTIHNSEVTAIEKQAVSEYPHYITALVNNTTQTYPQRNIEGVNTSNTFFPSYQNLWMQSMLMDREDSIAQKKFTITLYNVNLNQINFPYTLDPERSNEAVIGWYDSNIIANKGTLCEGCDNGCMYMGSLKERQIKVTLTSMKDNVVEGTFEGTLYLRGTGFSRFIRIGDSQEVKKGKFRILFRTV